MSIQFQKQQNCLIVELAGDVRRYDETADVSALLHRVEQLVFEVKGQIRWDSSAAAVLFDLIETAKQKKIDCSIETLPEDLQSLLKLALTVERKPIIRKSETETFLEKAGDVGLSIWESVTHAGAFLSETLKSIGRFVSGRAVMRRIDFEFALEDCGYKAFGIVSLVSFMVGLILAFVGALQLKMFGAQIYVASLVTIGMIRIMGAIMAGIIMAGRTGAAYAATIGTMQVNEEIDALKTFGFSVSDFLVLPRVLSLALTMPFLTLLADIMGMIGGASVAVLMLDISAVQYWQYSVNAFGLQNFWVGIFHGFVYGLIISSCGCYYGITCGRNADSVGVATTKAVVFSIVIMIVATGILTLIFQVAGI